MLKLVLFDVDGTLIRTYGIGVKAFACAFATLYKFPDATSKIQFAGRTDISLVKEYFRLNGRNCNAQDIQDFLDCYVFWLDYLLPHSNGGVCPGVREFIAACRRLPVPPIIGLLTGNFRLGAEIKLRHFGLWDEFEIGAFAEDGEDRNHIAQAALARGQRALGGNLKGNEVLVVGDTPHDIECGRYIGARVLAVCTGGATYEKLASCNPDWVVENLTDANIDEICS